MIPPPEAEGSPFPPNSLLSFVLGTKSSPAVFRVLRSFTPFTKAQVYLVRAEADTDLPSPLILKIYDPRFLDERRTDRPWTLAGESIATEKRDRGEVPDDFNAYHLGDKVKVEPWHWEAYYFRIMKDTFNGEIEAYRRLVHLQGLSIPKLYGSGKLLSYPPGSRAIDPPGALLEYIPGITLRDIDPAKVLPKLYKPLIPVVASFADFGVLHYDVNQNNIMFTPSEAPQRAVIIDFGGAVLRPEGMSDEVWKDAVESASELWALRWSLGQKIGKEIDEGDTHVPSKWAHFVSFVSDTISRLTVLYGRFGTYLHFGSHESS
ncbi:hypothetical protein ID866_6049 [Astraeus odoratus]|nr:hypothetical protein ID866_6049 [Astraeus odoratus]